MPDEAGCGMTILSLYLASVRSFHDLGGISPAFWPSTVLKQMTPRKASWPTQLPSLERNEGFSASTPFGV